MIDDGFNTHFFMLWERMRESWVEMREQSEWAKRASHRKRGSN